jgi:SecD/SecF fusion protein
MQNKGAIRLLAILLALVCLFQLSFTLKTYLVEKAAKEYAKGDPILETHYIDSISSKPVYNLLFKNYTYKECKEREISLGLDLKGGMNVTLEVSVVDILRAMSNYSTDSTFNKAIALAQKNQASSQKDFITLFGEAFETIDPNAKLAAVFNTFELKDKINFNSTNADVLKVITKEANSAIDNSFNILSSRIDRFGVVSPNIQQLSTKGRILVELPGVTEPERVRKLLQGSAKLEFWETYENGEAFQYLDQANKVIAQLSVSKADTAKTVADTTKAAAGTQVAAKDSTNDLLSQLDQQPEAVKDSTKKEKEVNSAAVKENPLFSILQPNIMQDNKLAPGCIVGYAHFADTAQINRYLAMKQVKALFPRDMKLLWGVKAFDKAGAIFELHAIKTSGREGRAPLDGSVITSASGEFGQNKSEAEVNMGMNGEGAKIWARLTKDNVGRCIAIVLDNYVYSAPRVNQEIKGGHSSITGNFTIAEAQDLANILKSGKMPAPARIIQESVVGPSLGQEAINAGFASFIIAFFVVLLYMLFYYARAGWVADIALLSNVFLLIGVLASIGAVLTLPGIAGIVLTLGMAVDANVIIYERIREELRSGKGLKLAVSEGYKHAMSAIIDGNLTTILTGVILFIFGSGPIQGFATTLVIGILTSMFCAIFISRLIFERLLSKEKDITFSNRYTANVLHNVNIDFMGVRKYFYAFSIAVTLIGLVSMFTQGFNLGVDFKGGRTYVVQFDQPVKSTEIQELLAKPLENAPIVKMFGTSGKQVKITTDYLVDADNTKANNDSIVQTKLYEGLQPILGASVSAEQFAKVNLRSSDKVGATIADDIKISAVIAVILALIGIFLYIFLRFRKWEFGLGGVVALIHDALFVLGVYSVFRNVMPFSMEIDQSFIAAILTVIGYSINDSVIVFDRVREHIHLYPKRGSKELFNKAINSTLGRTMNTSLTTLFTLVVMFIFGGDVIRGFIFALLVGITIGTYSSVLVATPIVYDARLRQEKKDALKAAKK